MVRNDYERLNSGAPEVSQNLNTVLVRQIVVEHQQVESAGGKSLEGRFTTHRDRRIITFVLERALQFHENILVVVRNQNLSQLVLPHCCSSYSHKLGCDFPHSFGVRKADRAAGQSAEDWSHRRGSQSLLCYLRREETEAP